MAWRILKKPVKLIIGWILFIGGVITAPIPLPIGQFIALVGLSLLVSESHFVRRMIQGLRRKIPALSRQMERVKPHLPKFLQQVIEHTHPFNP